MGGGVIKKRLAVKGQGKSGGIRVILFFKVKNNLFFADGWTKNAVNAKGTKEIEDDECTLSNLITKGILEEIADE